jgi:iron complex outermembrane receptor protein
MTKAIYLSSAAILALAVPAHAHAQAEEPGAQEAATPNTEDVAADASEGDGLEAIIVTAERRATNLQDVPIAATALSGDQLDDKAVERIADLQFAAPSLSVTDQGLTQSVNIRGIGIASGNPQVTNGVATYIDGVFQPPILTTSSFYDIAGVEVLRGPQGTLVGANSTGGALFINTRSPSLGGVEGYAEVGYGNYEQFAAEGAVNFPLADIVAIRAAGTFKRRDSFFDDIGPFDNQPDRLNEKAGRLGVLLAPGAFQATAKVEWVDKNTGGYAYRPIPTTDFAPVRSADIRTLTYNAPTRNYERAFLSSLELRYELDSGIVLRSVSGYTNKRINNLYDIDAAFTVPPSGASPNQTWDQFVRERQWSQEVNIISPTSGALNWIVGGYYQRNKIDVDIESRAGNPFVDPTDIELTQDKEIWGVFGQAGYHVTSGLELQLGLRYSHFKGVGGGGVTIGRGSPVFGPNGLFIDTSGTHTDGRLTGKAALNWTINDDHLVYAFAARGYKPGGNNSTLSQFDPETVWDYELGWKGAFFEDHLRTQVGAFYMDYKDFQFDARDIPSGQNAVANIGGATIKGIEFQAQAKFGGLGLDGGLAFVDSELDEAQLVNNRLLPPLPAFGPQCGLPGAPPPPACFDFGPFIRTAGGGPNLFSPKWSYNFGVEYELFVNDDISLTPRLNYAYVGPRWTNLFYNPQTDYLKGRGLLSAMVTLQAGDWTVEAWATNLTDKEYVTGQSFNNELYGAPREYGLRVGVEF